jgi:hypothetical protein
MSERHDRLMKILTEQQTTSTTLKNNKQLLYGDRGPSLPPGAHARLIAACTR